MMETRVVHNGYIWNFVCKCNVWFGRQRWNHRIHIYFCFKKAGANIDMTIRVSQREGQVSPKCRMLVFS